MQNTAIEAAAILAIKAQQQNFPPLADEQSSRFLGVLREKDRWQIHVNSQGMTLADKIKVEGALVAELRERSPSEQFSIYFRGNKTSAGAEGYKPRGASPAKKTKPIPGIAKIIAVASGKGGVGKSTVSCNLAVALSNKGYRVGILDADVHGPSVTMMLGVEDTPVLDSKGRLVPCEKYGVKIMSFGFFSDRMNPVMWRGPMVGKSIVQFCYDVTWGDLDYLIIDSPPGTGDVQLTMVETLDISGVVIVSTPQDIALIDAHKALSMFEKYKVPVLGLVENMSSYCCPQCGYEDPIFGSEAESMVLGRGVPLLARIPLSRGVRFAADKGLPVVAGEKGEIFSKLAEQVVNKCLMGN